MLAESRRIGRLPGETEVLLRPAGVPLDLLFGARLVALDVRHFEDALMEPRAIEVLRLGLRQDIPGLGQPIQTNVCALEVSVGRFDPWPQADGFLTFLDRLFELPHVLVHKAQLAAHSPVAGVAPYQQSIEVDGLT